MASLAIDRLKRAVGLDNYVAMRSVKLEWVNEEEYLPPTRYMPLDDRLLGKTNAGLITLMSGCITLSGKRLERAADCRPCLWMAEALLCFCAEASTIRRDYPSQFTGALTREQQALRSLCRKASTVFFQTPIRHSKFPPTQAVKNVVFLTSHILGYELRPEFQKWLENALLRLDRFAANPNQDLRTREEVSSDEEWEQTRAHNFGVPLPIEVVSPFLEINPAETCAKFREFLEGVDWEENPYLDPSAADHALERMK